MMDLLADSSGNLIVQNSDAVLSEGIDRVLHKIRINLRFFYGEWFLDITYGVKYYDLILVKNPDIIIVDSVIKAAIMDDSDILELISYESNLDTANRSLTVSFIVNTIYGLLTIESENLL